MADIERKQFQLYGPERKKALAKMRACIAAWGLKMPKVEPQVLDFGLGEFHKTGLIEYWVANETKEGYCGKFLFVFDGQTCPYHHHDLKHETFFILKGAVTMNIDGKKIVRKEGDCLAMAQGSDHLFTGKGDALLLEVSKPCSPNDNIFANKSIGDNGVV